MKVFGKEFFKKQIQSVIKLTSGELFYSLWGYGSNQYATRSIEEFVKTGFGKNPFVYMCVKKISDTISRLDIVDEKGNPAQLNSCSDSFNELLEKMATELLVTGNCFVRGLIPVGFNKIASIEILPAQYMKPVVDKDNTLLYWEFSVNGVIEKIPVEEIWNIHFANSVKPFSYLGLSPLESAMDTILASNNIFTAEAHIFKNRGISGLLTNDSARPMIPKDKEAIQKEMNSDFGGAHRANKILVSTDKLRFVQVGMSPQDLELLKSNLQKMRVICSIYGLDSALFNDPDNKTYSNRKEAEKSLYTNVCLPLLDYILSELNQFLKTNFTVDKSKIEVLKEVNETLTNTLVTQLGSNIININEARTKLGLEEIELPKNQSTLNGAQVTSLVEVLTAMGNGLIPVESARAVILSAFPTIPTDYIDTIINGYAKLKPKTNGSQEKP